MENLDAQVLYEERLLIRNDLSFHRIGSYEYSKYCMGRDYCFAMISPFIGSEVMDVQSTVWGEIIASQ